MDDRWYKTGLIYEVSLRTFRDGNGDGVGDIAGLADRLDYLAGLGVTCLWLLPFQPSPWRDGGYDIVDHCGVHPAIGTLPAFVDLVHQAGDRGMRIIMDLVLNHTSDEHPWFQAARAGDPRFHDYYVWADDRPPDADKGVVFPGFQKSTWSYDRKARRYYFHRFYDFQPDLNISNPLVREEMEKIIGFWVQLGVAGFRVDAAPFLIEPAGAKGSHPKPRFEYLHQLRTFLSWRRGDAVLLGEANVERDAIEDYYEVGGMHMLFNFEANRNLWLALARQDARPLIKALERTAGIPSTDQWANFLRNHDELDLSKLHEDERRDVFEAFGPDPAMQLYGRGIRRRLAPMLGGDRRRVELALSILLAMPGTPVLLYGDELGMGEDLALPERLAVRTPMHWTPARNAGFSEAPSRDLCLPVISRGAFGFRTVNVADGHLDPGSLLRWTEHAIRVRSDCPEFGVGQWEPLDLRDPAVLGLRFRRDGRTVVTLHNLAPERRVIPTRRIGLSPRNLTPVLADRAYGDDGTGLELDAYGYRWLRGGRTA